ncbi:hypothetical protein GCM10022223_03820 [Kineosporia mesophila]|uniref:Uncharacterized protein n=1 Tax=Kineosporia mesophila TaxID=566012 RepID=A0ABP6YWG3_9ACTN
MLTQVPGDPPGHGVEVVAQDLPVQIEHLDHVVVGEGLTALGVTMTVTVLMFCHTPTLRASCVCGIPSCV